MTLTEIFDTIRPRVERAFWEAWLEEGFEPGDILHPPPGIEFDYWNNAIDRCWKRADAKQAALYLEHDVENHPEMIFANQAKAVSGLPF